MEIAIAIVNAIEVSLSIFKSSFSCRCNYDCNCNL